MNSEVELWQLRANCSQEKDILIPGNRYTERAKNRSYALKVRSYLGLPPPSLCRAPCIVNCIDNIATVGGLVSWE